MFGVDPELDIEPVRSSCDQTRQPKASSRSKNDLTAVRTGPCEDLPKVRRAGSRSAHAAVTCRRTAACGRIPWASSTRKRHLAQARKACLAPYPVEPTRLALQTSPRPRQRGCPHRSS